MHTDGDIHARGEHDNTVLHFADGCATDAEVDVAMLGERLQREAETSERLLVLPPHVTAYARLPT